MLIRQINSYLRITTRKMSESMAPAERIRYDGRVKKRNWEERRSDQTVDDNEKRSKIDQIRIKKRKYAMLLGYSGVDYYGMQRNPKMRTIEEDLLQALLKTELISEEAYNQVQQIQFQRAARTDKGVSAAKQVVSLKLPEVVDISALNKELSEQIRVFSVKRVTKGFNSKSNCDARTYIYMLPTVSFAKYPDIVETETFRLDESTLNKVNDVLKLFLGTKNFHNFTSRKHFRDPSANRYIISFECEQPFIRKGIEFAVIKVKGQSFMMHQIRKMVGVAIAVVKGITTTDTITQSYTADRLDLPMAPGLGLVLDQVHYDRYNTRYGTDHETLDWIENEPEVTAFKEKYIYPTIIDTEISEKSMVLWLETLPKHSFSVRLDEISEEKDDEKDSDADDCSDDKKDEISKCSDDKNDVIHKTVDTNKNEDLKC